MGKWFVRNLNLALGIFYYGVALIYLVRAAYHQVSSWWVLYWFGLGTLLIVTWRITRWHSRPKKSRKLKSPHPDPSLSPPPSENPTPSPPRLLPSLTTSLFRSRPETPLQKKLRKLPEPVVGFRCWLVYPQHDKSPFRLLPLNPPYGEWNPGVNVARCLASAQHPNPASPDCGCGFWIKDSFKGARNYFEGAGPYALIGVAMGWGRTQVHQDGWRCQFASPILFAYNPATILGGGRTIQPAFKQLAMRFDLPLVEMDAVEPWYLENTKR